MKRSVITKWTWRRLALSLALGLMIAGAERVVPGRLPDSARELARLTTEKARLASATDAELARWQQRVSQPAGLDVTTLDEMLEAKWQRSGTTVPNGSVRFTREEISPREWPTILADLQRLESIPGIGIEHVIVSADGGMNRRLRVEITVRLGNAKPVAACDRLPVPRQWETGSVAASRGGSAPGQVRCSLPPRLSALPGLYFV